MWIDICTSSGGRIFVWTGGDADELVSPYSSAVERCCQSMTDLVTVAEATRRTFPVAVKGKRTSERSI